jgi:hypothetical protein
MRCKVILSECGLPWLFQSQENLNANLYHLNNQGMRTHRPEGFLKNLVVPLKPSGRFPSFLRRYADYAKRRITRKKGATAKVTIASQFASAETCLPTARYGLDRLRHTRLAHIWVFLSRFSKSRIVTFAFFVQEFFFTTKGHNGSRRFLRFSFVFLCCLCG